MDSQLLSWVTFAVIAGILVVAVVAILRFWDGQVNMSEEDVALERRVSELNENQANRRRDDEIVRLLRGDEQRIVADEDDHR